MVDLMVAMMTFWTNWTYKDSINWTFDLIILLSNKSQFFWTYKYSQHWVADLLIEERRRRNRYNTI